MDAEEELSTANQLADPSCSTDLIGNNVPVHTSLPPQVEGHLRCFLCLCISQIKWIVHQHPARTLVHITWWGETGSGTIFRPFDGSKKDKNNLKTTARYPVRSGPKQFKSYLNDMNVLLLEILDEDSLQIVGYAEVDHITTLTTYSPLKSIYVVSSLEEEKIAELHVSVTLEPLMESYDSSGFLPTVDISSAQTFQPTKRDLLPERISATHSITDSSTLNMPFLSSAHSLQRETPVSQQSAIATNNIPQSDTTVSITTGGNVVLMQNGFAGNQLEGPLPPRSTNSPDLISILLEKGNKLRETMVLSMADELPNKQGRQNLENPISRSSSCGSLLREILTKDDCPATNISEDSEDRVINLVLGPDHEELDFNNNPDDSSVSSLELNRSDISDPMHEAELLQDLFYTNQLEKELLSGRGTMSHSMSSLEDLGNQRSSSRRSSLSDNCDNGNTEKAMKPQTREKSRVSTRPKSASLEQKSSLAKSKTTAKSKPSAKPKSLSRPKSPSVRLKSPSSRPKSPSVRLKSPSSRPKSPLHTMDSPRSKVTTKSLTPPKIKRSPQSSTRGKKLKKKRRRQSGSCTASGTDASDTDSVHSESSRVSFDMAPSDVEEEDNECADNSKRIDGLSVERLTLLGRATVARVVVDALDLLGPASGANPDRKSAASNKSIGKPPKPRLLPQKSNSYFLEYQFPVVAAARDKDTPNTMATEVTRAAAKQVKENTVHFKHHSVFPLLFDGKSIENWWKSAINFKIYSRTPDQKTPSLIGCCQLPLKSILKAENLCLQKNLLVYKPGKQSGSAFSSSSSSQVGNLKVSVDIGSDTTDFSSALSRTRIAELNGKSQIIPIVSTSSKQKSVRKPTEQFSVDADKLSPRDADISVNTADLSSIDSHEFSQANHKIESKSSLPIYSDKFKSSAFQTTATVHQTPFNSYQNAEDLEPLALHSLLIINEGRKISIPPQNALHPVRDPNILQGQSQTDVRNIYLQCRMFWCDQSVNSSVCWGTNDPQFNFVQVSPVLISPSLLERMRNNYLVIEVWDKKTTTQDDELIGIVKLSLHQFYLSLRNKRITSALLKAQYPIIAHDCFVPIVDPLSNCQRGQLKVLLSIGSVEQVSTLQRVTLERYMSFTIEKEPETRNIDTIGLGRISENNSEEFVEYLFEIVIEDISHLPQLEEITWGETDCFIQYFFPFQTRSSEEKTDIGQQASLKTFRTATTPCIPDPSFQSITKHKFILYSALPVQTQLLNAFVDNEGNVTEVSFELWGRFYHPNVRDQVIAKATLPLVKLFAMVSMYKKEPLLQSFSLPLISTKAATSADLKNQKTGKLNITITYKSQVKQPSLKLSKSQSGSSSLYISVGLLRICGLQSAAEYCASYDSSMQYPCEVGVNTYIKAKLSFIHDRTCTTRTFARNFCPEVGQFFEFHCPLINKDSCSLAETLESAELLIEFWHQVPAELEPSSHLTTFEDVLLGVTEIPLIGLLTNNTGIQGWLPINRPASGTFLGKLDSHFTNQLEYVMGGLEVKVNFTHTSDHERLLHAADSVGWNLPEKYLLADNFEDFEDGMSLKVTINIDEVNVAKNNCMSPEQTSNSISQCYLKYIFHDKGPFVSKPLPFRFKGKDFLFAKGGHQNSFHLPLSAPLIWYLREEKVEVQLWCGSGNVLGHQFHRKSDRSSDKLIGSAWIPLGGLCHGQKKNVHRISGIYPMFKAGLPNLHGMYLRSHISLQFQKVQDEEPTPEESSVLDSDWNDSFLAPDSADFANIFQVHISIERAMHLTHITDKSTGKLCQPNAYVSFTTSHKNKMASTSMIFDEDCPVWEYDLDTILSSELLYEENKNLVFKVWHKPANVPKEPDKSSDQVIGFVSVDLAPLVSGLKQLCGWYNIIDFSGRCKGQVKLSVTPLESIVHHWNQLKSHINISKTADKSVSSQKSLPHFTEHYQNVKLHHELLQNQQQSYTHGDDTTNTNISAKSTTKKVAFASDSSSRSQLMSKLQQQMLELDELNAHLKAKLGPISLSTEKEPATHPISQGIGLSSSEQNAKEEVYSGFTNHVNPDLSKRTETLNVSEDLYTEQFSGVADRYLADGFNKVIPKSPAAVHEEARDQKMDEFLSTGQMQSAQLHNEEVDRSDYLFTAHPIGRLPSTAVPPPEWDDNYADLTAVDSELVQIFSQHNKVVENSAQPESGLEEPQQIHLDNDKESYIQDFKTSYGQLGAERFYVSDDDDKDCDDFEMEDSDEDEESVVIPRIVNDIPYITDQARTLANEEQDDEVNPGVTTEREGWGNIIHNLTDKKPPDGLGIVPISKVVLSDNVDSLSDTLDFSTEHDVSHNSTEEFQAGNDSPEIGKHIIFEEKLCPYAESTSPYLPPRNVLVERNAETTVDEALSTNPNSFKDERLSPDAFAMESRCPNPNQPLSKSNHDTNNPVLTNKKESELSTKENLQNKPPAPKVADRHPVKKILHTNFFLPLADLEQSMRAVKLSTAIKTYKSVMDSLPGERDRTGNQKPQAHKETKVPVKYTSLPTKEESQRIARIFSMKLS